MPLLPASLASPLSSLLGCKAKLAAPAVLHRLQIVWAWRITGLRPQYGADSDSGVFAVPGITVALANWRSLLDFFFFLPLLKVEVQEKLINVTHTNGFLPHFFCAISSIIPGPLILPPFRVPSRCLVLSLLPKGALHALRCRQLPLEGTIVTCCAGVRPKPAEGCSRARSTS